MKENEVIDVEAREVQERKPSAAAALCLAWLLLMVYAGIRTDGETWYIHVLVFGSPAIAILFVRFLLTGRFLP